MGQGVQRVGVRFEEVKGILVRGCGPITIKEHSLTAGKGDLILVQLGA